MAKVGYNGPKWTREAVAQLKLNKDVKIIDVLAGSGMVAKNVSCTRTPSQVLSPINLFRNVHDEMDPLFLFCTFTSN
jgi:hypothetical protein